MNAKDNIVGKINLILLNMPKDVCDLAKVRYAYKMLGNLFSYDFSIIIDDSIAGKEVNYDDIQRYQTCTQISEIFNVILNNINENSKSEVIERKQNNNSHNNYEHVANSVAFTDTKTGIEYKLLLDLTLDLFRIQSGMQTRQFAFTTDIHGTHDIISLRECEELDRELGILDPYGYTDEQIKKVGQEISELQCSTKQKIFGMWNRLSKKFSGAHEAKQYFESILGTVFPTLPYRSYNLYYKDVAASEFASLVIVDAEEEIYVLLDNKLGMVFSSKENINEMMKSGWKTSSHTLEGVIGYDPYADNIKMGI